MSACECIYSMSNPEKTPLTARDKELFSKPALNTYFPIVFANKNRWAELTGKCESCGKSLAGDSIRGIVSRPIETVAVVEAIAICNECRVFTRFDYRLHNDMRITGLRSDGWHEWLPKVSRYSSILRFVRNLIRNIFDFRQ